MSALTEPLADYPAADARAALVRAGGNPYVLLAVTDPESGQVELISQGFDGPQIVRGLREAADLLAEQMIEESVAF